MTWLTVSLRTGSQPLFVAASAKNSKINTRCIQNLNFTRSNSNKTCLYSFHVEHGARMELFAGYSMPIVYKNSSIKSEHFQTRNSASAFDVSHMMQTIIRGRDRCSYLESLTVTDIEAMKLDKSALSLFPNSNGGIIDDCIISKRSDHLHVVSNAGNSDVVWSWLNRNVPKDKDIKLERLNDKGLIALQGPKAGQVLQDLVDKDLTNLEFMNTCNTIISGIGECQVTRCGYTGEDGFEISVDAPHATNLMHLLCKDIRVKPAGLGARDTLRLEAGLCLHGHDINQETTPIEAGLNWTINKRRRAEGGFPGFDIIARQLKEGTKTQRVGLVACGSGPPVREGYKIIELESGDIIGSATSGTFAPTLGFNIAMSYVNSQFNELSRKVVCEVRGKNYDYTITKMPFVPTKYYIKAKS